MCETIWGWLGMALLWGQLGTAIEFREVPFEAVPAVVRAKAVAGAPGVVFHGAGLRLRVGLPPWRLSGQDREGHRVDVQVGTFGRVRQVETAMELAEMPPS